MRIAFKRTAVAILAAFGSAAMAQEATADTWIHVDAGKSRAQVQAELAQARKDGSLKTVSAAYHPRLDSVKSREQVRAELSAARASGELAGINAEASAYVPAPGAVLAQYR